MSSRAGRRKRPAGGSIAESKKRARPSSGNVKHGKGVKFTKTQGSSTEEEGRDDFEYLEWHQKQKDASASGAAGASSTSGHDIDLESGNPLLREGECDAGGEGAFLRTQPDSRERRRKGRQESYFGVQWQCSGCGSSCEIVSTVCDNCGQLMEPGIFGGLTHQLPGRKENWNLACVWNEPSYYTGELGGTRLTSDPPVSFQGHGGLLQLLKSKGRELEIDDEVAARDEACELKSNKDGDAEKNNGGAKSQNQRGKKIGKRKKETSKMPVKRRRSLRNMKNSKTKKETSKMPVKRRRSLRNMKKSPLGSSNNVIDVESLLAEPKPEFKWSLDFALPLLSPKYTFSNALKNIVTGLVYPFPDPRPPCLRGEYFSIEITSDIGVLVDGVLCSDFRPRVMITAMKRRAFTISKDVSIGDFIVGGNGMDFTTCDPSKPDALVTTLTLWPRPVNVVFFRPHASTLEGRWRTACVMSLDPYDTRVAAENLQKANKEKNSSPVQIDVEDNIRFASSSVEQPIELLDSDDSDGEDVQKAEDSAKAHRVLDESGETLKQDQDIAVGSGGGHHDVEVPPLQYGLLVNTRFGIGSVAHRDQKELLEKPYSHNLCTVKLDWGKAFVPRKDIVPLADNVIGSIGLVSLTQADLWRLGPGRFLNDNCVDAMLDTLNSCISESTSNRVHIYNSFFNTQLRSKNFDAKHMLNMTRGRGIDILTKDFLFVPINKDLHWSLAVVCNVKLLKLRIEERIRKRQLQANKTEAGEGHGQESEVENGKESTSVLPQDRPETLFIDNPPASISEQSAKPRPVLVGEIIDPEQPSRLCVLVPPAVQPGQCVTLRLNQSLQQKSSNSKNYDPASTKSTSTEISVTVPKWFAASPKAQEIIYDTDLKLILPFDENLTPCVMLFDSLKAHRAQTIMRNLRNYLGWTISEECMDDGGKQESLASTSKSTKQSDDNKADQTSGGQSPGVRISAEDLPVFHVPNLPRQKNGCDCGVFLIMYLSKLLTNLPHISRQVLDSKGKLSFGENWFSLIDVAELRMRILDYFVSVDRSWCIEGDGSASSSLSSASSQTKLAGPCLSMVQVIKAKISASTNLERQSKIEKPQSARKKANKKAARARAVSSNTMSKADEEHNNTSITDSPLNLNKATSAKSKITMNEGSNLDFVMDTDTDSDDGAGKVEAQNASGLLAGTVKRGSDRLVGRKLENLISLTETDKDMEAGQVVNESVAAQSKKHVPESEDIMKMKSSSSGQKHYYL